MTEDVYATMATKIVAEQSKIIGPIAYTQASKVPGLVIDKDTHVAIVQGDGIQVVDELVHQYKLFFGDIAVEVSKEAIGNLKFSMAADRLPNSLK